MNSTSRYARLSVAQGVDGQGSTRRRLVLAAAAGPLTLAATALAAQPRPTVLLAWLNTTSRATGEQYLSTFQAAFADLGWKEGANYRLEQRWADGVVARLPQLAAELAVQKPALFVAATSVAAAAASKAAPRIPIVLANGDPLASGLVTSLARPAGMITGLTNIAAEVSEKHLELLLAVMPKLRRVGFLADTNTGVRAAAIRSARRSTEHLRIEARFAEVARAEEIEAALAGLAREEVQALILLASTFFVTQRQQLLDVARRHRWPVVTSNRVFAEAGALLTYGADQTALYGRAASYVDRILKGAKPGDLPIELPGKYELVVNTVAAAALGLTIPAEFLARADLVIR